MAIYYNGFSILNRYNRKTKKIQSAVETSAYKAREKLRHFEASEAAAYIAGETLKGRTKGKTYDYSKKRGVIFTEILLPEKAPERFKDRQLLWNAVEVKEKRYDAQLAREFKGALPRELDYDEQIEVAREYAMTNFVDHGMIADVAIHDPDHGNHNPHVHIMLTMREVNEQGFGNKDRSWNEKERLLEWREQWAVVQNKALKAKGYDLEKVGVDHRSYREQGSGLIPQIHEGKEATALKRKGILTEVGWINDQIRAYNMAYTKEIEVAKMEVTAEFDKKVEALYQTLQANLSNSQSSSPSLQASTEPGRTVLFSGMSESQSIEQTSDFSSQLPSLDELENQYAALEIEILDVQKKQAAMQQTARLSASAREDLTYRNKLLENYSTQLEQIKAERAELGIFAVQKHTQLNTKEQRLAQSLQQTKVNLARDYKILPTGIEAKLHELETAEEQLDRTYAELTNLELLKGAQQQIEQQYREARKSQSRAESPSKPLYREQKTVEQINQEQAIKRLRDATTPKEQKNREKNRAPSQER